MHDAWRILAIAQANRGTQREAQEKWSAVGRWGGGAAGRWDSRPVHRRRSRAVSVSSGQARPVNRTCLPDPSSQTLSCAFQLSSWAGAAKRRAEACRGVQRRAAGSNPMSPSAKLGDGSHAQLGSHVKRLHAFREHHKSRVRRLGSEHTYLTRQSPGSHQAVTRQSPGRYLVADAASTFAKVDMTHDSRDACNPQATDRRHTRMHFLTVSSNDDQPAVGGDLRLFIVP
ncbi:hypothetical protein E4U41_003528 [Claviceps citrina]|nr:hypothetical protein E4U41_003528 [Claviceps citrina]